MGTIFDQVEEEGREEGREEGIMESAEEMRNLGITDERENTLYSIRRTERVY